MDKAIEELTKAIQIMTEDKKEDKLKVIEDLTSKAKRNYLEALFNLEDAISYSYDVNKSVHEISSNSFTFNFTKEKVAEIKKR
uniref:TPR_REGION domain-containing protein n=1 Tax=Parastrongyloides trichosuri TaxID=131310 RepID=A0A0N5A692_PARTI